MQTPDFSLYYIYKYIGIVNFIWMYAQLLYFTRDLN